MIYQAFLLVFPVCMSFAAANDLFTMRIPNKISIALILGFAASAIVAGMSMENIGWHLAIGIGALSFTFTLFSLRLFGGGDAKLLAAGALWMGQSAIVEYVFYVTMFGGILSVLILAYRRLLPVPADRLPPWMSKLHEEGTGIPYGIAIAAGALVAFPKSEIFTILMV